MNESSALIENKQICHYVVDRIVQKPSLYVLLIFFVYVGFVISWQLCVFSFVWRIFFFVCACASMLFLTTFSFSLRTTIIFYRHIYLTNMAIVLIKYVSPICWTVKIALQSPNQQFFSSLSLYCCCCCCCFCIIVKRSDVFAVIQYK